MEQSQVRQWFEAHSVDQVYLSAAKAGGIGVNSERPAEFLYANLAIQTNVIHEAWRNGVSKLLFLGSSCIYPRLAPQPIREDSLLTGPLETTNESYAVAKIAGVKMCQAYRKQYGFDAISVMPTNLYGPGDNFDLGTSHVLPALLRKIHEAKESGAASAPVWGSGRPRREFMHVDDVADACLYLMDTYSELDPINIGWGEDIAVAELAKLICDVVGFEGAIDFDLTKPDGTPRKLLDVSRLAEMGWRPRVPLEEGLRDVYEWYCAGLR